MALVYVSGQRVRGQSGTRTYPGNTRSQFQGSSNRGTINQGSGTQGSGSRVQPRQQTYEERFWQYLEQAQYKNWGPVPGKTVGMYPGQSPHGDQLKMYLNRTAAGNPKNLAHGSILIKENYSTAGKLMAITVMYRSKNYDPQHNDWYYAKYNPDGSIAMKGNTTLGGRVQGCIDCHSSAAGNDFVFAND